MRHIYTNLKRFDVPAEMGGVNRIAAINEWGASVVGSVQNGLASFGEAADFTFFFPEAHLISALSVRLPDVPMHIGCQGVYREDVRPGGNFGAFTSNRPAAAVKAMGCEAVLIGHCEERRDKAGILAEAGVVDTDAINRILNREIMAAVSHKLRILYCIGETEEEKEQWQDVLRSQLEVGLDGIDASCVVIAYEPIWAIGPGKIPPDRAYIQQIARFVKEVTGGLPVVYGGGLKADNAAMLASIPEIDGGLIALTRFSGEIGFYPNEYLEIVSLYLNSGAAS